VFRTVEHRSALRPVRARWLSACAAPTSRSPPFRPRVEAVVRRPRGAGPPDPPQVIAQGEEEAAEAKEQDNAPGGLDLGEVHEEELADDNEERCRTAPNEGGAVEA
jgi:hypothetical protein